MKNFSAYKFLLPIFIQSACAPLFLSMSGLVTRANSCEDGSSPILDGLPPSRLELRRTSKDRPNSSRINSNCNTLLFDENNVTQLLACDLNKVFYANK